MHGRTIMVENIPAQYRTDEALKEYFEFLFPGGVVAQCCQGSLEASRTIESSRKVVENLESSYVALHNNPKSRPKSSRG